MSNVLINIYLKINKWKAWTGEWYRILQMVQVVVVGNYDLGGSEGVCQAEINLQVKFKWICLTGVDSRRKEITLKITA
jgi:hypothetical protein